MKNILLALTLCGAAGIGYAAWFAPANLFDSNEVSHAQVVSEHLQRQSLQEVKAAVSSYTTKAELETAANKLYTTLWGGNWGFNCRPQILGLGADDIVGGVYALHRGIETFQVDCQIGALRCHNSALLCKSHNYLSYYNKSLRCFQDGTLFYL